MEAMMLEVEAITLAKPLIGYWMNWMGIIFLLSLLFVWKHRPARWVLPSFILTMIVAMIVYAISGNVHLVGVAHFIVWIPLLKYLCKTVTKNETPSKTLPYLIWVYLLMATILISLVFDLRDIILVIIGVK